MSQEKRKPTIELPDTFMGIDVRKALEEILAGANEQPKQQAPLPRQGLHSLKPVYQGLGEDYGLVFRNWGGENIPFYITPKGNSMRETSIKINSAFYDLTTQQLYFTQGDALMATDGREIEEIRKYGVKNGKEATPVGIWRDGVDILVCLPGQGKIADHEGKVLHDNLEEPLAVRTFNGRLYHAEGWWSKRCLVDTTKNESVATCGSWADGLDISIDGKRLYFGGEDKKVYSYDGRGQREISELPFMIWSIHSVNERGREVLYVGGGMSNGIHTLELDNGEVANEKVLLKEKVLNVGSIAAVPLEFLEKLDRNFGVGEWK